MPKPTAFTRKLRVDDTEKYFILTASLPTLVASEQEYKSIKGSSQSAADVMQYQFLTSFFLQLFLSSALSMLWNIFNTLQIICALDLLMVKFPANVILVKEQF